MPGRAVRQYFMVKSESKNMKTRHKSKNKKVFIRGKKNYGSSTFFKTEKG